MPTLIAAGTADQNDVALVEAELAKMPEKYRQAMQDKDAKVVVVRNSVTERLPSLAGTTPRGWPPGKTWDSVPGLYDPSTNDVVIATVGHGTMAGPHVPVAGEGHGSANLVLHESAHAIQGTGMQSPGFGAARNADSAALSSYELQQGDAGLEEAHAESFANVFGGNPNYSTTHQNLANYWNTYPDP
jgi:hypothetical protein